MTDDNIIIMINDYDNNNDSDNQNQIDNYDDHND